MDDTSAHRARLSSRLRLFWLFLNGALLFSYAAFNAWDLTKSTDREQGVDETVSLLLSAILLCPTAIFLAIFFRRPRLLRTGKYFFLQVASVALAIAMGLVLMFM